MSGSATKPSNGAKGKGGKKKKDPLEGVLLTAMRETYRASCMGQNIKPYMPLLTAMDDLSSQTLPLEKVIVVDPDPDFGPSSVRAMVDSISGDSGMCSVASLIAASADSFTCGARLLLFELVGGKGSHHTPASSAAPSINCDSRADSLSPFGFSNGEFDKSESAQGYNLRSIEKLASAMAIQGCQLKALQLSHINLGDAGFKVLQRGLKNASNLKRLTLAYNKLTSASAVSLSFILYKHESCPSTPALTELDLQGNLLGTEILEEFSKTLGTNQSLIYLNLDNNIIRDSLDSAARFADAIIANGTQNEDGKCPGVLSSLSMDHNPFGSKTVAAFLRALEGNPQLKHFRVPSKLDREIAMQWKQILVKRNTKQKKKKKVVTARKGLRKR